MTLESFTGSVRQAVINGVQTAGVSCSVLAIPGDTASSVQVTTNPQQIEVMEFELIDAEIGDYSRRKRRRLVVDVD